MKPTSPHLIFAAAATLSATALLTTSGASGASTQVNHSVQFAAHPGFQGVVARLDQNYTDAVGQIQSSAPDLAGQLTTLHTQLASDAQALGGVLTSAANEEAAASRVKSGAASQISALKPEAQAKAQAALAQVDAAIEELNRLKKVLPVQEMIFAMSYKRLRNGAIRTQRKLAAGASAAVKADAQRGITDVGQKVALASKGLATPIAADKRVEADVQAKLNAGIASLTGLGIHVGGEVTDATLAALAGGGLTMPLISPAQAAADAINDAQIPKFQVGSIVGHPPTFIVPNDTTDSVVHGVPNRNSDPNGYYAMGCHQTAVNASGHGDGCPVGQFCANTSNDGYVWFAGCIDLPQYWPPQVPSNPNDSSDSVP